MRWAGLCTSACAWKTCMMNDVFELCTIAGYFIASSGLYHRSTKLSMRGCNYLQWWTHTRRWSRFGNLAEILFSRLCSRPWRHGMLRSSGTDRRSYTPCLERWPSPWVCDETCWGDIHGSPPSKVLHRLFNNGSYHAMYNLKSINY